MKLALNTLIAVTNEGISELLVLCERAGLERPAAYAALADSALASPFVQYKQAAFLAPDEASRSAFTPQLMLKDLRSPTQLAGEVGAELPAVDAARAVLERTVAAGQGDERPRTRRRHAAGRCRVSAVEIVMPRLSDAMEQGTIVRWLKQVGDQVDVGDELVEVETDKATVIYEAEVSGLLSAILVREGEAQQLGGPIAPASAAPRSPRRRPPAAARRSAAAAARTDGRRPLATPVARRRARELGVDLRSADRHRPARAHPAGRRRERRGRTSAAAGRVTAARMHPAPRRPRGLAATGRGRSERLPLTRPSA